MSWLFGRRKHHKDSPPDSPEEDQQSNQDDSFIVVEKRPAPPPPISEDGAPYPTSGLYPSLAGGSVYPVNPHAAPLGDSVAQGDATNYLTGVPFKLCKQLERNMNDDTEIDNLRVGEIKSFLDRIGQQNYNYSFSLEEGIVAEIGMVTTED